MDALQCVKVIKITQTESTEEFPRNMSSNVTLNDTKKDLESQSSNPSKCSRFRRRWWFLFVDLPLILIVIAAICLFEVGIIPNHKGGFYCNDPSLSYPYRGETVSSVTLMTTVFLLPIVMRTELSCIMYQSHGSPCDWSTQSSEDNSVLWNSESMTTEFVQVDTEFSTKAKLRQAYRNTLYIYRTYLFGFLMNLGVVEVMKGLIGSPRPTFFELCQPDAAKTCNGSEFVSTFECTSTQYWWWYQMDSYRSFPSGHASLSVYCGFFVAWYLQKRAFDWSNRIVFLVPILQMLSISFAAVSSLTRITDHRHHWWDVLVGAMVGLATVYYAIIALGENFSSYKAENANNLKSEASRQTVRTFMYDEGRSGPLTP